MLLTVLTFAFIFVLSRAAGASASDLARIARQAANKNPCLRRFSPDNKDFDTCRERPCFIFLREEPYIRIDPRMQRDDQTVVFNCSNPTAVFKGLGGTAFEVIRRTAANQSACVWGGPECLFGQMVNFIDETRKNPQTRDYQFAATGLLLENADRVREHIIPTISLIKEELVIFGVDRSGPTRPRFPLAQIVHPFKYSTWGAFAGFFWAIVFTAIAAFFAFGSRPVSLRAVAAFYVHGYSDSAVACTTRPPESKALLESSPEEVEREYAQRVVKRLATYKVAKRLIRIAISSMIVIFLLFYELAVAQFLFVEQKKPNLKDVRTLTRENLMEYSVEKDAATENTWHRTVFAPGKYKDDPESFPWKRCSTNSECFDWALDPSNPVRYVVGFKSAGTYQVLHRSACNVMTVYGTENELYKFGAGWLYGGAVPPSFRRAVDRDIASVSLGDELHAIADRDAGTLDTTDCKTIFHDIDVGIIGALVIVLSVPTLVLLFLVMLYYCVRRIPVSRDGSEMFMERTRPRARSAKRWLRARGQT